MIKLILGAVIGVMLFTSVAKADEKAITPQEFVNTIAAVPHKVSAHVQSEWEDIKAYQAKSWADSKDQFARTVDSFKSLFTTKSSK